MFEGVHKHECRDENCGTIWIHDSTELTAEQERPAHECPKCGLTNFWMYFGDKTSDFVNHHLMKRIGGILMYTEEQLEAMTVPQLRGIVASLAEQYACDPSEIVPKGARKDLVISSILECQESAFGADTP